MEERFVAAAEKFLDEYPELSPVSATSLGDHRFDHRLDHVSAQARAKKREFCQTWLKTLGEIDRSQLNRASQVDHQLLVRDLETQLWKLDELEEWAWNPIVYTQLTGGAIYGLMAREFAPVDVRLGYVADRLEKYGRLYREIRESLDPKRVPLIHAQTAIKQNRGVISIIDNMVRPEMDKLSVGEKKRLDSAITLATRMTEEHQRWLEDELLPQAGGDFRLGKEIYDEKLARTLGTSLTRQQIRERAEFEMERVRKEMYEIACRVIAKVEDGAIPAGDPTPEQQQDMIKAALNLAAKEIPGRGQVVPSARDSLKLTTDFVRSQDLVSIPDDPLEIIVMPEFQRGVSVAYCDSPGPLEVGQQTFYAVAPLPDDWTDEQCESFLREYNIRSIHNLTVHEAMPGHFLQLAYSNRYPSRLRSLLSSGVFIEGWACYTEQMMSEEGFQKDDPLMRLVTLKWYLRTMANAILDQSIHVDGMRRDEAMHLMTHDTFQEESEAAGKWTRAQLTSAQLSTYFVGYQEHRDLRTAAEKKWGNDFRLKRYHDAVISFGSPPTRFVQALVLEEPIPED